MTGLRQPVVGVCRNPLLDLHHVEMKPVAVGVSLGDLRPEATGALRCMRNGEPLYPVTSRQFAHYRRLRTRGRADDAHRYLGRAARRGLNWRLATTRPGDIVVWHDIPQDKESGRTILGIAALVVSIAYPALAPYAALLLTAYNIFVPPSIRQQQQLDAANSVFSTSLNGNQARLDQPIWRNCGVNKITPPFAGQPYFEFLPSGKKDDAGRDIDADQYYYAVFAVGVGKNVPLRVLIGKTPASSFQDILERNYLPPGVQPTRALCNVVTSGEVTGLAMESDGKYVGGFVATQPTRNAVAIGIDMAAPQGLGTTSPDGDGVSQPAELTISWRVEAREIDRFARPSSAWRVIGNETRTANTNTPQRWSNKYVLATPARVEVRVVRTDIKDTNPNARSDLQWVGLRAYLEDAAPLNPNTAHYEVVMRASEQLSNQSQHDFSILNEGYSRTWNPVDGWSCELGDYDNYTATRTPAWYLADLWSDPVWGEGLPDERIDLQGLYEWSLVTDARQDHFDHTFDSSLSAWDAAQLIARTGRAHCFRRFGVNTIARDELATLPKTAFSPRNTVAKSMACNEALPTSSVADGIVIQYTSNVIWDTLEIECPCPGFSVSNPDDPRFDPDLPPMTRPIYDRLEGVSGAHHAEREGLFQAAAMALRTRTATATTEMQGMVLSHLDAVQWQPEVGGYQQSGDVAFWDAGTLLMGLTEPVDFSAGSTWLTLMRDDGSLTTAVQVYPGPTEWDVVLPATPDFDLVLDDGARERPKFFAGTLDQLVRVVSITDAGKSEAEDGAEGAQLYQIEGFVDDERVHTADVHLLPGPGEIQDPVDTGGDTDPGGGEGETLVLVRLLSREIQDGTILFGGGIKGAITLRTDGTMFTTSVANNEPDDRDVVGEWMLYPVELADAARFEVMASTPTGSEHFITGSALGTWLNLGTQRSWALDTANPDFPDTDGRRIPLLLTIREASSGAVQAAQTIGLTVFVEGLGTGAP